MKRPRVIGNDLFFGRHEHSHNLLNLNGEPINLKTNETISISTCFKYNEVFSSSGDLVDLEDGDNQVFCSIIEIDFQMKRP